MDIVSGEYSAHVRPAHSRTACGRAWKPRCENTRTGCAYSNEILACTAGWRGCMQELTTNSFRTRAHQFIPCVCCRVDGAAVGRHDVGQVEWLSLAKQGLMERFKTFGESRQVLMKLLRHVLALKIGLPHFERINTRPRKREQERCFRSPQ